MNTEQDILVDFSKLNYKAGYVKENWFHTQLNKVFPYELNLTCSQIARNKCLNKMQSRDKDKWMDYNSISTEFCSIDPA